jgi:tetratricopeptide (TPR) repeat protein
MSQDLERARLLYEQSRYKLAVQEVQKYLATTPSDPEAQALLAMSLCGLGQYNTAKQAAAATIALAPNWDYGYSVLAHILTHSGTLQPAYEAIQEAIRLNPTVPPYFTQLSHILGRQSRYPQMLAAATQGLALNPEEVDCLHNQGAALWQLGQLQEAKSALEAALMLDPEHQFSHANLGWILLSQNASPERAAACFRQALQINPNFETAHQGLLQTVVVKQPLYKALRPYYRWEASQNRGFSLITCIAFCIIGRGLVSLSSSHPELWWVITPYSLITSCILFAQPLLQWSLLLNNAGRAILRQQSNFWKHILQWAIPTVVFGAVMIWGLTGNIYALGIILVLCGWWLKDIAFLAIKITSLGIFWLLIQGLLIIIQFPFNLMQRVINRRLL